jgi:RNA polymerase subunit RPABC4/transcription elongation factor Spt4
MELRRCPSCTNLINPQSVTCPICGLSYAQAILRKTVPWVIIVLVSLGLAHRFIG